MTRKGMVLKPEFQELADDFSLNVEDRGCTCFLSPPCGYCTHEGNPANLDECDEAWESEEPPPMPQKSLPSLTFHGFKVVMSQFVFPLPVIKTQLKPEYCSEAAKAKHDAWLLERFGTYEPAYFIQGKDVLIVSLRGWEALRSGVEANFPKVIL